MDAESRAVKANDYDYPDDLAPLAIPYDATETRVNALQGIIRRKNARIAALEAEVEQLRDSIATLETEHVPAPHYTVCPLDYDCAICAEARERGRVYDWNANVRADGAYQE